MQASELKAIPIWILFYIFLIAIASENPK
uniref:Uncharacterized protein n=1 Tax=Arundo donax TaxID=35708 RepID=A0A0A9H7X4_ARUDO